MTPAALRKHLVEEQASLEKQRAAAAVRELQLREALDSARATTAFIEGRMAEVKTLRAKLEEAKHA